MGGTGFSAPRHGWSAPGLRVGGRGRGAVPFSLSSALLSLPFSSHHGPLPIRPSPQAWGLLSLSLQNHSSTPSPQEGESLAKTGARCTGHQSWMGRLSGHQRKALTAQVTPLKAWEGKAQLLSGMADGLASLPFSKPSCHLPLLLPPLRWA